MTKEDRVLTTSDVLSRVESCAKTYDCPRGERPRVKFADCGSLHLTPMTSRSEPVRDTYADVEAAPRLRAEPADASLVFLAQARDEFAELVNRVVSLVRRTIAIEIGFERGASHLAWLTLFDHVASIDIDPRKFLDFLARFSTDGRSTFVVGDSGDPRTIDLVTQDFPSFDFLFIDGNHQPEAFLLDYCRYAPFVRDGGLVAIHDAVSQTHVGVPAMIAGLQNGSIDGHRHAIDVYGTRVGVAVESMNPAARNAIRVKAASLASRGMGTEGPCLIEAVGSNNIVHYAGNYYAVPWSAGPVDVRDLTVEGPYKSSSAIENLKARLLARRFAF
jgi:predicted O-methyltransferase YrrM